VTDPKGRITYVNDKFCKISKYNREELLGQDHRLINSGYHSKEFIRNLWTTINQGKIWHGEIKNKAKDGSFYWVATTIVPFLDNAGKPNRFVAIRADITERKQAEAELARQSLILESVLNNMGNGVVVADENGKFLIFNPAAKAALGSGPIECNAEEWPAKYGCFQSDQVTLCKFEHLPLGRALRGETCDGVELYIRNPGRPDGGFIECAARAIRTADNTFKGGVVVFNDITSRKKAELDLKTINQDLRRKTIELSQKNQEVEAFVYVVSHDLRAPLVNLQGYSSELELGSQRLQELLQSANLSEEISQKINVVMEDDIRHAQKYIAASANKFDRLINSLLTLSRTGRHEFKFERLMIDDLVRSSVDVLYGQINKCGANLVIKQLPEASGDRTAVGQIFSNLICNALNYLDPTRQGEIEVGGEHQAEMNHYWVRDNGVGIPYGAQQKLFQVFQRFHPKLANGEGMGLAIVKRIVEKHGGRIWAESEEGAGTIFHFTLPPPQKEELQNVHDK
jgi:PAS domain S-box-containing protein